MLVAFISFLCSYLLCTICEQRRNSHEENGLLLFFGLMIILFSVVYVSLYQPQKNNLIRRMSNASWRLHMCCIPTEKQFNRKSSTGSSSICLAQDFKEEEWPIYVLIKRESHKEWMNSVQLFRQVLRLTIRITYNFAKTKTYRKLWPWATQFERWIAVFTVYLKNNLIDRWHQCKCKEIEIDNDISNKIKSIWVSNCEITILLTFDWTNEHFAFTWLSEPLSVDLIFRTSHILYV